MEILKLFSLFRRRNNIRKIIHVDMRVVSPETSRERRIVLLRQWYTANSDRKLEGLVYFCRCLSEDLQDGTNFDLDVIHIIEDESLSVVEIQGRLVQLQEKYTDE